jgi:hypothetical protein
MQSLAVIIDPVITGPVARGMLQIWLKLNFNKSFHKFLPPMIEVWVSRWYEWQQSYNICIQLHNYNFKLKEAL